MTLNTQVQQQFETRFKTLPDAVICSPGRVNLIGEHTDYNDGFVLPMAINRATYMAVRKREDRFIVIESKGKEATINLNNLQRPKGHIRWPDYIEGVAHMLEKAYSAHALQGFDACVLSDLPIGAGLSSSASFELGIACALSHFSNFPWDKTTIAKLCQKAENQWIGVNCGIMDQLICAGAKMQHASLIDCRSLALTPVPLPPQTVIVIMDTGTRRGLAGSAYNERRTACELVATTFGAKALRDVSLDELYAARTRLDPVAFKRAHHVITENERVLQAASAMRSGDAKALGQLMLQSHHSLNDDFEVTNEALNIMVNIAKTLPGCFGARMTGAGFGGCAVALVAANEAETFIAAVKVRYEAQTPNVAQVFATGAEAGCEMLF